MADRKELHEEERKKEGESRSGGAGGGDPQRGSGASSAKAKWKLVQRKVRVANTVVRAFEDSVQTNVQQQLSIRAVRRYRKRAELRRVVNRSGSSGVDTRWLQFLRKIRYRFDRWIDSPGHLVIVIISTAAVFVFFSFLLLMVLAMIKPPSTTDALQLLWLSWCYLVDFGSHLEAEGDEAAIWRAASIVVSIAGFILSSVIFAVVIDAIRNFLGEVSAGRSEVVEAGHYCILGFTMKTIPVIVELCRSIDSEGGGTIVVLADTIPKVEFDHRLKHHMRIQGMESRAQVIFKSGSPHFTRDLMTVSIESSRAVLILSDEDGDIEHADFKTLRVLLAVQAIMKERFENDNPDIRGHVVAEMRDIGNRAIVEISGGRGVKAVYGHDAIGRILANSVVHPQIGHLFDDVLGFNGQSICSLPCPPSFVGLTFAQVAERLSSVILLGVRSENVSEADGEPAHLLCPAPETTFEEGDELVALANVQKGHDASADLALLEDPPPSATTPSPNHGEASSSSSSSSSRSSSSTLVQRLDALHVSSTPLSILCCGWRRDMLDLLLLLDKKLPFGSELTILSTQSIEHRNDELRDYFEMETEEAETKAADRKSRRSTAKLQNFSIKHVEGNPATRKWLENALRGGEDGERPDFIMVVVDAQFENDMLLSDSHTIATCLLVRAIQWHMDRGDGGEAHNDTKIAGKRSRSYRKVEPRLSTLVNLRLNLSNSTMEDLLEAKDTVPWLESQQAKVPIVAEILDETTRDTVEQNLSLSALAEFIVVNDLSARLLAVVAHSHNISEVFDELLGPFGCEFFVKPVGTLLQRHEIRQTKSLFEPSGGDVTPVSFAELSTRARSFGWVLIGYTKEERAPVENAAQLMVQSTTVLNPAQKHQGLLWDGKDKLILLGEEDSRE